MVVAEPEVQFRMPSIAGGGQARIEVVSITPALAAEWLARNTHNRHIRESVWRRYSGAMARGEWMLNGETIKFDANDVLLDGQHRLLAVVDSGVTIEAVVVWGLPSVTQETLDHHTPRRLSDHLTLRGEKSASDLATTLVVLYRYSIGQESRPVYAPTIQQALGLLDANPGIRDSVPVGNTTNVAVSLSRGVAACCHYLFSTLDPDDAAAFFARLRDGVDLAEGNPIYALREWALRELRGRGIRQQRPHPTRQHAFIVKAWNAYRRGDEIKQLKWRVGGANPEPFPRPE